MISWRQQNTKSQFFASCHHGPGLQFLFLFSPTNCCQHDFCSIQYFACFSHLELWHYQGCYLPRICNPESLLCARTLEKLRQPGSVDVVGKKRQSVEAHLSRMKVWMIAFQIGMPPVGASTSSLSPLDVDFTHLCPTKRQNVKEATSPHVLLVFTYALARHWALGFA